MKLQLEVVFTNLVLKIECVYPSTSYLSLVQSTDAFRSLNRCQMFHTWSVVHYRSWILLFLCLLASLQHLFQAAVIWIYVVISSVTWFARCGSVSRAGRAVVQQPRPVAFHHKVQAALQHSQQHHINFRFMSRTT